MNRRGTLATCALAAIVVAGVACRVRAASGRELWYDDVMRLGESLLSWEAIWSRLPTLDNMKSPVLISLHHVWTALAGHDSLLAIRGLAIVFGAASIVLAADVGRRVGGRIAGLAAAATFAFAPLHVARSIDVHDYVPAQAATLAAWAFALSRDRLRTRDWVALGLLAGFAVSLFPLCALPAAALLLLPAVRSPESWRGPVAGVAAAAVFAVPSAWSVLRSYAAFSHAYTGGTGWLPPFDPLRSAPWAASRLLGMDALLSARLLVLWPSIAAVVGIAAWTAWRGRADDDGVEGGGAPLDRPRLVAVAVAAWAPFLLLAAGGFAGAGTFNDYYLVGAAALAPAVTPALLVRGARFRGVRAWASRAALAACGALLAAGAADVVRLGPDLDPHRKPLRYAAASLVADAAREHTPPPCVFVHGNAPAMHVLLRAPKDVLARTRVRQLTTAAWMDVLRRDERTRVSVPHALGWPFAVAELAGPDACADADSAAAAVRRDGEAWFVFESIGIPRRRYLEEEETERGLDAGLALLTDPPTPARDAAFAAAVLRYLGLADDAVAETSSSGHAVLVRARLKPR